MVTKGDTGEGVVEEIRELVGPKDVSLAKEEAPERYNCSQIIFTVQAITKES